jgi:hypothetical protein
MSADCFDSTLREHDDQIRMAYSRESMGDDEARSAACYTLHSALDKVLAFGIQ